MIDGFIQVPVDGAGKLVDCSVCTTSAGTVYRERDNVSDPTDPLAVAAVRQYAPKAGDYGLVVTELETLQNGSTQDLLFAMFKEMRQVRLMLATSMQESGAATMDDFDPNCDLTQGTDGQDGVN